MECYLNIKGDLIPNYANPNIPKEEDIGNII